MTRTQVIAKPLRCCSLHQNAFTSALCGDEIEWGEKRFSSVYLSTSGCSLRLSPLTGSPFVWLCCTGRHTLSLPRECVTSSRACREHPTSWLCSMFSLPPRMRWSLELWGGIIFWCPDVVSTGFPNLWTRSREKACRVEAYNLPDLLLIYSLKQ